MIATTRSKALDLYLASDAVVGQDRARKEMAALLERQWMVADGRFDKSSAALLAGRSGTGKTRSARLMCRHLDLPYAEADDTRHPESGYKGLDLQPMILPLLQT